MRETFCRCAALGAWFAFAATGCSAPAPQPAHVDPETAIVRNVSVPAWSITVGRNASPPSAATHAPNLEPFSAAGYLRRTPHGLAITDAGLDTAWLVERGAASWDVGPAHVTRITGIRPYVPSALGAQPGYVLTYDIGIDAARLGSRRIPNAFTAAGEAISAPVPIADPNDPHDVIMTTPAPQFFAQDGRLAISPADLTALVRASLPRDAGPPVRGVIEFGDPRTARACPDASAILVRRRALGRALFSAHDTLRPVDGLRLFVGVDDATRAAVAAPAGDLVRLFERCARTPRLDAHTVAWAALWADDAALVRGGTIPQPATDPANGTQMRAYEATYAPYRTYGNARRARIAALAHAPDADVATYARWLMRRGALHDALSGYAVDLAFPDDGRPLRAVTTLPY